MVLATHARFSFSEIFWCFLLMDCDGYPQGSRSFSNPPASMVTAPKKGCKFSPFRRRGCIGSQRSTPKAKEAMHIGHNVALSALSFELSILSQRLKSRSRAHPQTRSLRKDPKSADGGSAACHPAARGTLSPRPLKASAPLATLRDSPEPTRPSLCKAPFGIPTISTASFNAGGTWGPTRRSPLQSPTPIGDRLGTRRFRSQSSHAGSMIETIVVACRCRGTGRRTALINPSDTKAF